MHEGGKEVCKQRADGVEELVDVGELEDSLIDDNKGEVELVGKRPSKCVSVLVELLIGCTLLKEGLLDQRVDRIGGCIGAAERWTEGLGPKDKAV